MTTKIKAELLTNKFEEFCQEQQIKRCEEADNKRALQFIENWNKEMGVRCRDCDEVLPLYHYAFGKTCLSGLQFTCCIRCHNGKYCPFARKIGDAGRTDKAKGFTNTISVQRGKQKYEEQEGFCAIFLSCGIKVPIHAKCGDKDPFNMSLERIDNTKGHTDENTIWVCTFWQTRMDNTEKDLVDIMFYGQRNDNFDFEKVLPQLQSVLKPVKQQYRARVKIHRNFDHGCNLVSKNCTNCGIKKSANEFSKDKKTSDGKKNTCKTCDKEYQKARYGTMRGKLMRMVENACRHAEDRGNVASRNDESYQVDDNLLELAVLEIIKQKGRCALTGIPFVYKTKHLHMPSIDRIDNSKGYIKGNIRIVVNPLNNAQLPKALFFKNIRKSYFEQKDAAKICNAFEPVKKRIKV